MEQKKKYWLGLIGLAALLVGVLLLFVAFRRYLRAKQQSTSQQKPNQEEPKPGEIDWNPVSFFEAVLDTLDVDTDTAKIITAQAMHETGVFTSPVFLENNNAFGMRRPEKRETTAISENRGYAVYESVQESIKDLKLWFDYNGLSLSFGIPATYAAKIREYGYYEADYASYAGAMKAHLKKLDNLLV